MEVNVVFKRAVKKTKNRGLLAFLSFFFFKWLLVILCWFEAASVAAPSRDIS